MPSVFGDIHDKFIQDFLDTTQSKILNKEKVVYAKSKEGYLIPCTIMIKLMP